MITVEIRAEEFLRGMEARKDQMRIAFFNSLVRSTALARETAIENIRKGMGRGLGWRPFARSTIARKAKRGRSLEGLVDTARMMTSIHENVNRGALEGHVFPGVDYFKYHEKGTRRMPARESFAPVPGQINRNVEDIFKEEVARAIV